MNRDELIQHCIAAWNLDGSGSIESRMSKAMDVVLEEAGKVADTYAAKWEEAKTRLRPIEDGDSMVDAHDRFFNYIENAKVVASQIRALKHSPSIPAQYERAGEVDQFIPLADVQREAETCRIMLDKGEGDTGPLYAAYNALLMVLGYGTMPPSEMHAATPSPATGERLDGGVYPDLSEDDFAKIMASVSDLNGDRSRQKIIGALERALVAAGGAHVSIDERDVVMEEGREIVRHLHAEAGVSETRDDTDTEIMRRAANFIERHIGRTG